MKTIVYLTFVIFIGILFFTSCEDTCIHCPGGDPGPDTTPTMDWQIDTLATPGFTADLITRFYALTDTTYLATISQELNEYANKIAYYDGAKWSYLEVPDNMLNYLSHSFTKFDVKPGGAVWLYGRYVAPSYVLKGFAARYEDNAIVEVIDIGYENPYDIIAEENTIVAAELADSHFVYKTTGSWKKDSVPFRRYSYFETDVINMVYHESKLFIETFTETQSSVGNIRVLAYLENGEWTKVYEDFTDQNPQSWGYNGMKVSTTGDLISYGFGIYHWRGNEFVREEFINEAYITDVVFASPTRYFTMEEDNKGWMNNNGKRTHLWELKAAKNIFGLQYINGKVLYAGNGYGKLILFRGEER